MLTIQRKKKSTKGKKTPIKVKTSVKLSTLTSGRTPVPRKAGRPKRTPVTSNKLKGGSPLTIVKKDMDDVDIQTWLSTSPGFIEGLTETDFDQTRLYGYQVNYMLDNSMYKHIDKSRQTGFSYVFAAEGLAKAHLMNKYTKIFISINQEEANEKIVYARALYETIPLAFQKKLVVDNKKSLEFEGYTVQGRKSRTRIISHAQREPRGKGGNTEVVLDEAAHYMYGDKIYVAAVPIITRGKGGMTVGSTPLGKTGIHWEIVNNPNFQKIYTYFHVMWWNCRDFIRPGTFKEAQKIAPKMGTEERVHTYGNDKLISIFISLEFESFQQEYECHHIDETVSYFPIDLIKKCCYKRVIDSIFLEDDENAESAVHSYPIEEKYPKINFRLYDGLEDLLGAKMKGEIKGDLYAGFDVGRRHHSAELIIIEDCRSGPLLVRLWTTFRNVEFVKMEAELKRACDQLHLRKLRIDETAIGIQLGENMWRHAPGVTEVINFTNSWKEEAASHMRRLLEAQLIAIPDDRKITGQIHSIKRIVTDHGNLRFDAEANKEHHGDIFWAIALACWDMRKQEAMSYNIRLGKDSRTRESLIKRPEQRLIMPNVPLMRRITESGRFGLHFPRNMKRPEL